jgi:hypothetical protein
MYCFIKPDCCLIRINEGLLYMPSNDVDVEGSEHGFIRPITQKK